MKRGIASAITLCIIFTTNVFAQKKDSINETDELVREEVAKKETHFGYHPANYKHHRKAVVSTHRASKTGSKVQHAEATNYKMPRGVDTTHKVKSNNVVQPNNAIKQRNYKQPNN